MAVYHPSKWMLVDSLAALVPPAHRWLCVIILSTWKHHRNHLKWHWNYRRHHLCAGLSSIFFVGVWSSKNHKNIKASNINTPNQPTNQPNLSFKDFQQKHVGFDQTADLQTPKITKISLTHCGGYQEFLVLFAHHNMYFNMRPAFPKTWNQLRQLCICWQLIGDIRVILSQRGMRHELNICFMWIFSSKPWKLVKHMSHELET